jgi:hypothetical protein
MKIRFNAWQRIGILVSLVWFIGFAVYVWGNETQRGNKIYRMSLAKCEAALGAGNNWAQYEMCNDEAAESLHSQFDDLKRDIPILFAVDVGTVVLSWFIVLSGIMITRWVRRGESA